MKKFKPFGSRIIVKINVLKTTKSGIYIPETAQKGTMDTLTGEVVIVGENTTQVKVGDNVAYGRYSGGIAEFLKEEKEDTEYRIMNEDEILGILI